MKIEIDYKTADALTRSNLKDALATNSNEIMRGVVDIIKHADMKAFQFDDVVDAILNYASLASALRYYSVEDEWREVLRESFGYETR